jgi:hypothetical protein
MKTRTTLTLDEDNARRLTRLRKERDISLKDAVNEVIRRGLDEAERPFRPAEPFKTRVFPAAQPLFKDSEELRDLIVRIQDEEDHEKLARSSG